MRPDVEGIEQRVAERQRTFEILPTLLPSQAETDRAALLAENTTLRKYAGLLWLNAPFKARLAAAYSLDESELWVSQEVGAAAGESAALAHLAAQRFKDGE